MLHLSYKLPIGSWQARTEHQQKKVKQTKQLIQDVFRVSSGLLLDMPKAGTGNSNDGNTSRRFVNDIEAVSEITGVDEAFLENLRPILELLCSSKAIDCSKFADVCSSTALQYVELWYPMSPTLRKTLIHGSSIIKCVKLPIDMLSEEAAEHRNKHFRNFRKNFARRFSRTACNEDISYRLRLSSDPLLSCLRPESESQSPQPFSMEAFEFSDESSEDEEI